MNKVLIDTDVVLDFFFGRKPFSDSAAKIFSLCESGNLQGFVTPVICSNAYYLLRKTAQHKKVIDKLGKLITLLDVLTMDGDVVLQALNSGFQDFEDALQNFSAVKFGLIDVIITRNVKDYGKSDIGVLSPDSYLKAIVTRP